MSEPIIILGAGLAGLSCAHHLGSGYLVLEREATPGGLARTFDRDGFRFDLTGHWLHLNDAGIERLVGSAVASLVTIERRAAIYSHGVRTRYPFQAHTYGLPAEVVADCLLGYLRAREEQARGELPPPRNFEDYIRRRLGDGIARHFMIPYNTKLWTVPPSELAHSWCERFVPWPTPEQVVLGALRPEGAGAALGYNATFLYPADGGIARLPEGLRARLDCEVRCGVTATRVDWRRREVRTEAGAELGYTALVSTMPLPDLVACLADPPQQVADAAARLRATTVTYWNVGVARPNCAADPHWTYFPEPHLPFYRAGSPSAAVASLAPPDHRSYYVELSHPHGTPCRVSDEEVIQGLRLAGLLQAQEHPALLERRSIECAYVIMDEAYGDARGLLLDWLLSQRIISTGRFGAWTYASMEDAMILGRQAAERARGLA